MSVMSLAPRLTISELFQAAKIPDGDGTRHVPLRAVLPLTDGLRVYEVPRGYDGGSDQYRLIMAKGRALLGERYGDSTPAHYRFLPELSQTGSLTYQVLPDDGDGLVLRQESKVDETEARFTPVVSSGGDASDEISIAVAVVSRGYVDSLLLQGLLRSSVGSHGARVSVAAGGVVVMQSALTMAWLNQPLAAEGVYTERLFGGELWEPAELIRRIQSFEQDLTDFENHLTSPQFEFDTYMELVRQALCFAEGGPDLDVDDKLQVMLFLRLALKALGGFEEMNRRFGLVQVNEGFEVAVRIGEFLCQEGEFTDESFSDMYLSLLTDDSAISHSVKSRCFALFETAYLASKQTTSLIDGIEIWLSNVIRGQDTLPEVRMMAARSHGRLLYADDHGKVREGSFVAILTNMEIYRGDDVAKIALQLVSFGSFLIDQKRQSKTARGKIYSQAEKRALLQWLTNPDVITWLMKANSRMRDAAFTEVLKTVLEAVAEKADYHGLAFFEAFEATDAAEQRAFLRSMVSRYELDGVRPYI